MLGFRKTEKAVGLVHLDARWYNPYTSRFVQPDLWNFSSTGLPVKVQHDVMQFAGLNSNQLLLDPGQQMRFGYVSGNPINSIDLIGLEVLNLGRDLDVGIYSLLPGEHQFTALIPDDQSTAVDREVNGVQFNAIELADGNKGYVLGAHKSETDTLVLIPNQSADVKALDQSLSGVVKPGDINYSTETFPVENSTFSNDSDLIDEYLNAASNYQNNTSVQPEPYRDPVSEPGDSGNSNSWNQSLHDAVGSNTTSDMSGYDMYNEYRIDAGLFGPSQSCPN